MTVFKEYWTRIGGTRKNQLVVIANGPCLLGLNALSQLKLHISFNTATHQKQIFPDLFRKVMQCSENSGGMNIPSAEIECTASPKARNVPFGQRDAVVAHL